MVNETPDANLPKGMCQLNGVYIQASSRRHQFTGHLFQGRYKSILGDTDAYLLELTRYVALNPVRAGMVEDPGEWCWSSFRVMIGKEAFRLLYPSRIGFPEEGCVILVSWQGLLLHILCLRHLCIHARRTMTRNSRTIARNRNAATGRGGRAISGETYS